MVSKGIGECIAYGEMLPTDMSCNQHQASGLGQKTRALFLGEYQKQQTQTGYGAFAISGAYNSGSSFNWERAAEARDTALSFCESDFAKA